MIAIVILTFGLLAAGQFLYVTMELNSLARSKATATIAAQNTLEYLADLYQRNPWQRNSDPEIMDRDRPRSKIPSNGTLLNLYNVTWTVEDVPDPRPGKAINARRICMHVHPIQDGGAENIRPLQ